MPSFEEEAFSRAQQMHSRVPQQSINQQRRNNNVSERREEIKRSEPVEESSKQAPVANRAMPDMVKPQSNTGLLDNLFGNREQSIILLLIVLLMEENADPSLLLALMYILL